MKALLFSGLAAVGLTLGLGATDANAYWAYRTVSRWDPNCCHYVPVTERRWVPDCEPCPRGYHRVHRHHEHEHFYHR
jgi:hypothetical protein